MVMEQKMELRGSAGELLRSAVTPYIQNLSESHFPCHNDKIVDLWKMIIGKQCWTEGRSSTAIAEDLGPTATATVAGV